MKRQIIKLSCSRALSTGIFAFSAVNIEAMMMAWLNTFFASRHFFVAGRQYLSGILLPSTNLFLFSSIARVLP
jgi:hypothetical protein